MKNILIIDDDEAYRTILGRHLASFCERVRATANQKEGLAAVRAGEVDCLVLDLMMPEVDGLALLQQIRDDSATEHLPVVICSSKVLSAEEQVLVRRLRARFHSSVPPSARSAPPAKAGGWPQAHTARVYSPATLTWP